MPDTLPVKDIALVTAATAEAEAGQAKTDSLHSTFHNQLKDLGDGLVGKLVVRQSGRMTLVLGSENHVLDVTPGTTLAFHQQLVTVDPSYHTPYFNNVAPVPTRVMAAPNISQVGLFRKIEGRASIFAVPVALLKYIFYFLCYWCILRVLTCFFPAFLALSAVKYYEIKKRLGFIAAKL